MLALSVLFTMAAGMASAQNTLEIRNNTASGTVGTVTATFKDNSTQNYSIGGPGSYSFSIGTQEVASLTFGTTVCAVGQTVTVPMSSGGTATAALRESINDEARSFTSIIR